MWKDILKAHSGTEKMGDATSLEEKILAEIKKEGGALGMKNLKQFGKKTEIKRVLSKLEKEGKVFMHRDGDIYTHKPSSKRRGAFTA
jgi:hypothetical protein